LAEELSETLIPPLKRSPPTTVSPSITFPKQVSPVELLGQLVLILLPVATSIARRVCEISEFCKLIEELSRTLTPSEKFPIVHSVQRIAEPLLTKIPTEPLVSVKTGSTYTKISAGFTHVASFLCVLQHT
jgi:hypothetical protein